jgi:hypothetical protein
MIDERVKALEEELKFLKEWIIANNRRLEDLESNAFFLEDHEEVLLVTVPRKD